MKSIFNLNDIEKKTLLILRILSEAEGPLGAKIIAEKMKDYGVSFSERAVRHHLQILDSRGLTVLVGRREGRIITPQGREELGNARVRDKIGFVLARIETLAFRTELNVESKRGMVPINVSFFPEKQFLKALKLMKKAFQAGLCVSTLTAWAPPGNYLGEVFVPQGYMGFATVCSIVVNGFLLKKGIPMGSRFAGILQIKKGVALRFVEIIDYTGSSLDPSEIFIRGRMTSVRQAVMQGEGKILANFREVPALARALTLNLITELKKASIGGVLSVGEIGDPLCEIPVDVNRFGLLLIGGLNPVALAHEAGISVENRAMATLMDMRELRDFEEICRDLGIK